MVILFAGLLMGGLYLLQKILYRRYWNRGLSVELSFDKEIINAGDTVRLYEMVENRKWLPLSSLKVKFRCSRFLEFSDRENSAVTDSYYRNDLFSLMPYRKITRTHSIRCPKRGCYGIYGIDLVGVDLFFSQEMVWTRSTDTVLYVLPKPLDTGCLREALVRISGEVVTRRHEMEDPFTFRGIRDYEAGDEMKNVNWKASARTGELKVNVREHTAAGSVRIFMNLENNDILPREKALEACISICSQVCRELLAKGIRVSIFSNARDCVSGQILQIEGYSDMTGLGAINKSLARLDLEQPMESFETALSDRLYDGQDTSYTLFLSPDRHESYQRTVREYKESGREGLWICPVLNQREMQEAREAGVPALLVEAGV